jgi:hypothetical protein
LVEIGSEGIDFELEVEFVASFGFGDSCRSIDHQDPVADTNEEQLMLRFDCSFLSGVPGEVERVVRERDVAQYLERHGESSKDVVDSVFVFGEDCELLAGGAEGQTVDGLAFGEPELLEDEGVVEGGDAVELD